jgi:hypothetical protein
MAFGLLTALRSGLLSNAGAYERSVMCLQARRLLNPASERRCRPVHCILASHHSLFGYWHVRSATLYAGALISVD